MQRVVNVPNAIEHFKTLYEKFTPIKILFLNIHAGFSGGNGHHPEKANSTKPVPGGSITGEMHFLITQPSGKWSRKLSETLVSGIAN